MSLKPRMVEPIPELTARIAQAAFPKGNLYMRMRDEFGTIFADDQFSALFPHRGQPALAPWRLALVTLMQFVENLSDRQAVTMVSSRLDWKYALSLELEDPVFDASVLCEFRLRLLEGEAEAQLFETLLSAFAERQLLKTRGRQRTDSTHVLAAVRALNRLETIGETLRHALNVVAEAAPEWLSGVAPDAWFDRYGKRMEAYRLPKGKQERAALAVSIGEDGFALLASLAHAPEALAILPAVRTLRRVWVQQFLREGDQVRLRDESNTPPGAKVIRSPYDEEARLSVKRDTVWTGYKVHLTETCDADTPHLITDVQTIEATTPDSAATPLVQRALAEADRLPSEHLVDEGYTQAEHFATSKQLQIDLVGPVACDPSWQHKSGLGYGLSCFAIDWEGQRVTCPAGNTSQRWFRVRNARKGWYLRITFAAQDCNACALRSGCTRSKTGRSLYLHPREEHEMLHARRQEQQTSTFRQRYAARAGIEGTLSEGIRSHGLRIARYVGQAKLHLQHLAVAAAMNFCRVFDWLTDTPLATTRKSRFARLRPAAVS